MSLNTNTPIRILIVDDHPSTAATLARAISQLGAGIEVVSTDSGEKAMEFVQQKAADMLITDMMMPGMNGLELIEKLQTHPGGRPSYTVLITAYDVPGLKESARRLKVNDVMIKPIRPERICQIVTTAIQNMGHVPTPNASETKSKAKILITDDLPDNVALLSRYLQNDGYLCLSASNGEEALARIRAEMPDLVLLDINMPVKDGFQTLVEIRNDPAIGHIPVIFLTARMEPMDMQSALNMGADDYVTKPFDRRELLARIRTRLRVKEAEDIIRRRNKELNLLPEIGKELSARLDIDELIDIVLRRTVETLGGLLGHFILLTPEGTLQKTHRFSGSSLPGTGIQLPPIENLLALVADTRQGLIINDTHTDSRWLIQPGDPSSCVVIAPLFGRFNLLGLLILAHEQTGYFSLEHKLLLQAIASQAAIALENAQLYRDRTQKQQPEIAALPGKIHSVLVVDAENHLVSMKPANKKFFRDHRGKREKILSRGNGYDLLIGLLEETRAAQQSRSGITTTGPGSEPFETMLLPMENGGCTVLLFKPGK